MTTVSGTPTQITVQMAGIQGAPGSVWRNGAGAPSNSLGVNGDYYLNDTTGDVYLKATGAYSIVANIEGPAGPSGPSGAPGSVWRNGSGAPSNGLGINGDYYLNDANGDVYQKAAGVYSVVANIEGPTGSPGAPGSVWRNGSGAPSNGLGINGDYYLDDATGNVYQKALGTYSIVANITGPAGSTGATGAPGSVWRNGSGAPSNGLGINGDFYLDDVAGNVYQKAGGAYSIVANITGPAGPAGQGVPTGGTVGQVLAKIDGTNYNTHWVDQSGGGGFISSDRAIGSGSSDIATTSDGLILWNSAAAATKLQTIPASTGSLQVIIIMDFFGNSDVHPIIIAAASGDINNTLPSVTISTPGGSLTLLDSILGWVLQ